MKQLVREKEESYNCYLQGRKEAMWEEYKRKSKEVKVHEANRRSDERGNEKENEGK